jgi:hypothetical protein
LQHIVRWQYGQIIFPGKLIAHTGGDEASGQLKIALTPFFLILKNLHRSPCFDSDTS